MYVQCHKQLTAYGMNYTASADTSDNVGLMHS